MSVGEAPPRTEAEMLSAAAAVIRDRLPATWTLQEQPGPDDGGVDAVYTVQGSDGRQVTLFVEAKHEVRPRDLHRVRNQLAHWMARRPGSVGVVVAPYLSESAREHLAKSGLSYADATGNLLLRVDSPALFLRDRGADRDPWRGPGRPQSTLNGEPAAKIVRALADIAGPWKIRELVDVSGASTGSVYRVLEFLNAEKLASRDEDGLVVVSSPTALLRRWSRDYQFLHANTTTRWIAPRGMTVLMDRMRKRPVADYAVTGSLAASVWAPYAPTRSMMLYATDPEQAAQAWDLRPAEAGANVLIARPAYPVVLERTRNALDGLRIAAPSQVAVDLLTGPGRAPAEAEELLDWMERNEQSWR
ncbi:hypothetical protein [Nocardia sp. NPDC004260]